MTRTSDWEPLSQMATEHPDLVHTRLRSTCPVAYSTEFGGFWALTKFADIAAAAKDPDTFSSEKRFIVPDVDLGVRWLPLQSDPPEHGKYRSIIQPFFQLRRVRTFEAKIRELIVGVLDASGYPAEADLCAILAMPLTGQVLCMYLGFPDDEWDRLKVWTDSMVAAANAGDHQASVAVLHDMTDFVSRLRDDRRARPRPVDDDLMSALVSARIDDEPIPDETIDGMFKLFMSAGHDTTNHGLSNLLRYLAENPAEQQRLRENPSLIPNATEEMLRYYGPVQALARTTTRDIEVRGTTIPAGETVALVWASAGRDEEVHDQADKVILDRESTRHLAFGTGVHRCVGADLARVQIQLATEELLARTHSITLSGTPALRGWAAIGTNYLPVHIEWAK